MAKPELSLKDLLHAVKAAREADPHFEVMVDRVAAALAATSAHAALSAAGVCPFQETTKEIRESARPG